MLIFRTFLLLMGMALSFGTAASQENANVEMFADLCINQQVVTSCHQIADLFAGEEVDVYDLHPDRSTSFDMMKTAHEISCDNNRGEACYMLQYLQRLDCNFDCDTDDGDKYIVAHTKGCELDYLPSCVELGMYHLFGTGSLTSSKTNARSAFDKACNGGPDYCSYIADKVIRQDEKELSLADVYVPYALRACPADGSGTPDACFDAAMNMELYNRPQDFADMHRLMETLCEQHRDAEGCYYKGLFFEGGLYGASEDPVQANEYYEKACSLGLEDACR